MSVAVGESAPAPARRVPRAFDASALLLMAAGGGLFLYARTAIDGVVDGVVRYADGAGSNVAHVAQLERLSQLGIGLVAAGVALSIAAFAWFGRRRQPPISQ